MGGRYLDFKEVLGRAVDFFEGLGAGLGHGLHDGWWTGLWVPSGGIVVVVRGLGQCTRRGRL